MTQHSETAFWADVESVLDEVAKHDPGERDRALHESCGNRPAVQKEVASLLAFLPDPETRESGETNEPVSTEAGDDLQLVGARLGDFAMEELIGRGGMGVVYRARQDSPNRDVAVKIIASRTLQHELGGAAMLKRFQYEIELLGRVDHPNLAQVFTAGQANVCGLVRPYIAMELVQDAQDILFWSRQPSTTPNGCMHAIARVADAIHAGHAQGIIHRDLKPANILIDANNNPKVIDLGIAAAVDGPTPPHFGLTGTPAYMAPEQQTGRGPLGAAVDIYALGVVLRQCMERMTAPDRMRMDLAAIIEHATAPLAEDRYSSAASFAQDIRRLIDSRPVEARPASPMHRLRLASHRSPLAVGATGVAAAALVGGFITSTFLWREASNARTDLARENSNLVKAEAALANRNHELEESLAIQKRITYLQRLNAAFSARQAEDWSTTREIVEQIDSRADDFAIRLLRHELNGSIGSHDEVGANAYKIALAPDGRYVASATGMKNFMRFFRRGETEPYAEQYVSDHQIYTFDFADEGRMLVIGTGSGQVGRMPIDEDGMPGEYERILEADTYIHAIRHHPVLGLIAIATGDNDIYLLRDQDLRQETVNVPSPIHLDMDLGNHASLTFSPDGSRLVVGSSSGQISRFDVSIEGGIPRLRNRKIANGPVAPRKIKYSPDGQRLAVAERQHVAMIDADTMDVVNRTRVFDSTGWSIAWSPDGRQLAAGGWDHILRIINAESLKVVGTFVGSDGPIWWLEWPEEDRILSGEENASLRIWRGRISRSSYQLNSAVVDATKNPDGEILVADGSGKIHTIGNDRDSIVKIESPAEPTLRTTLYSQGLVRAHPDRLEQLDHSGNINWTMPFDQLISRAEMVISPDESKLCLVVDNRDVHVIDQTTGKIMASHEREEPMEMSKPTWWFDGSLHVSDIRNSELAPSLDLIIHPNGEATYEVAHGNYGPRVPLENGNHAFTSMTDDNIFLHSAEGEIMNIDRAHAGAIIQMIPMDNQQTLATGGLDGTVRLWSIPHGEPLFTLRSKPGVGVYTMKAFDDETLLVGHEDGTIRLYQGMPKTEQPPTK